MKRPSSSKDKKPKEKPSKAVLRRMLRVAGVKRYKPPVYDTMRGLIRDYLQRTVGRILAVCALSKRKTVNEEDVRIGVEAATKKFIGAGINKNAEDTRSFRSCPTLRLSSSRRLRSVASKEVKYYQKNSDYLFIAKSVFYKLIKKSSSEKVSFKKHARELLQLATQNYIIQAASAANFVAVEIASRQTVYSKDFEMALKVRDLLR